MQSGAIRTMMEIFLAIFLMAFLLLLSAPSIAGKIYRWVDENGQVHFSDSPQNAPKEIRNELKEYKSDPESLTVTPVRKSAPDKKSDLGGQTGGRSQDSISIPYTAKEGRANRVIIDVTFNGNVTAPILVDTGSPGLVLADDLADQLGLFDSNGSRLLVLVSGIGGAQAAVRTIIEKISIGAITEEFIPAHIVPKMSDSYRGLIGMDILSSYTLTIDPAHHRLVATEIAASKGLPAGRDQFWWQTNFGEFNYYQEFWEQQLQLLNQSGSPYSRVSSSKRKQLEDFITRQKNEAQNLYRQLERYARWNNVPRHWRR